MEIWISIRKLLMLYYGSILTLHTSLQSDKCLKYGIVGTKKALLSPLKVFIRILFGDNKLLTIP